MLKSFFDFFISIFSIIIFCPILIIIAFIIYFINGKPVIFKQLRPGLNEVPFFLYKFRTMSEELDAFGKKLPDKHRITKLGKFLRKTSLDELPSFFNVLKGDMSIVGPRPLLMEYLPLYNSYQRKRHEVKPGITGLAQINGRNAISWDEKFAMDIDYVKNNSFFLDLKILFATILVVIKQKDISSKSHATIENFKGNP